jgi:hypothetical protein
MPFWKTQRNLKMKNLDFKEFGLDLVGRVTEELGPEG